jgi:hypothetical protein
MIHLASSSAPASQVVTGVLGFLVVAGMGLALFFLLRSLNKQLRKVVSGPRWREEARGGLAEPAPAQHQPGEARPSPLAQGRPEHLAQGQPEGEQDGA